MDQYAWKAFLNQIRKKIFLCFENRFLNIFFNVEKVSLII